MELFVSAGVEIAEIGVGLEKENVFYLKASLLLMKKKCCCSGCTFQWMTIPGKFPSKMLRKDCSKDCLCCLLLLLLDERGKTKLRKKRGKFEKQCSCSKRMKEPKMK